MSKSLSKVSKRDKRGRITGWKLIKADNFRYVKVPIGAEAAMLTLFRRLP